MAVVFSEDDFVPGHRADPEEVDATGIVARKFDEALGIPPIEDATYASEVHWTVPQGEMFIWMTLPTGLEGTAMLVTALARERIAFVPGAAFHLNGSGRNTIRLAYSLQPESRIEEGTQ